MITVLSSDVESAPGNPEHGTRNRFTSSEVAYLSEVLLEASERARDIFRSRIIDRLHDVLNGKVG